MSGSIGVRGRRLGGWAAGACCLLAAGGVAAAPAARVTSAVGDASSGAASLEMRGALEDGADLETGEDGNCSLLVDQDALMEVCGGTSLRLARAEGRPDGPRVVELDQGEIRMLVEPRLGEERIEIHTPAAIATILGTILHVSVDALGVTTITSESSRVLVRSRDPNVPGEVTIEGGQQLVAEVGKPIEKQVKEVGRTAAAGLSGCLIDFDFKSAALASDRRAANNQKVAQVVEQDVAVAQLPPVAQALDNAAQNQIFENRVIREQGDIADPNQNQPNNVIDNIVAAGDGDILDQMMREVMEPPFPGGECPGIPGEGCGPF